MDLEDEGLLAAYRSNPSEMGFATFEDLLTDGVAAGAVVEGSLVALAHTNAMTTRYGDIGVATDELWRGKGFASSAASIVARRIQERGRTPVWSAGEGNAASLRVAAKLGFVEVSRRVYLNYAPAERNPAKASPWWSEGAPLIVVPVKAATQGLRPHTSVIPNPDRGPRRKPERATPSPRRRPGPRGGARIPPQRPISTNTHLSKHPLPSVIPVKTGIWGDLWQQAYGHRRVPVSPYPT